MERPDDFEVMRRVLERERSFGVPFDLAWDLALSSFEPIEGNSYEALDRHATLAVLAATEEHWRAGYERRKLPRPSKPPPPVSRSLRRRACAEPAQSLSEDGVASRA